jgi:3D (Asp-Asp-Asp) domain-containing protein
MKKERVLIEFCITWIVAALLFNVMYNIKIPRQEVYNEPIVLEVATISITAEIAEEPVIDSFNAVVTHYGPDCVGCSGITASGYNVSNTIYYNDSEFGQVRIISLSKKYPLYTIVRLNNYKGGSITAIVLDRGGAIKGNKIDLLVSSESEALKQGTQKNVSVDVLRWGK